MKSDAGAIGQSWEDDLAAVAKFRDKDAFARLFNHFCPRIKAYLVRNGASQGQAEDIAQETMVTVWRKAHLFDRKKAAASTWLFTIARNQRIDKIRRERRPEPEVVMLSFYEDESHSAIAERLQLPIGTVKSRIRLALKRMDTLIDRSAHGVTE